MKIKSKILFLVGLILLICSGSISAATSMPAPINGVVNLTESVNISSGIYEVPANVTTINLNGNTITASSGNYNGNPFYNSAISLVSGLNVVINGPGTITSGSASGTITLGGDDLTLNGVTVANTASSSDPSVVIAINCGADETTNLTVTGGSIIRSSSTNSTGIALFSAGELNLDIGNCTISAGNGIATNGLPSNTGNFNINIGEGGSNPTITGSDTNNGCGIYISNKNANVNISSGTISGQSGIVMAGGDLDITGGTVEGTGAWVPSNPGGSGSGPSCDGSAIIIQSPQSGTLGGMYGDVNVTISGDANISSTYGYAIEQTGPTSSTGNALETIAVEGGTFTAGQATALNNIEKDSGTPYPEFISGGTFKPTVTPNKTSVKGIAIGQLPDNGGQEVLETPEEMEQFIAQNPDSTLIPVASDIGNLPLIGNTVYLSINNYPGAQSGAGSINWVYNGEGSNTVIPDIEFQLWFNPNGGATDDEVQVEEGVYSITKTPFVSGHTTITLNLNSNYILRTDGTYYVKAYYKGIRISNSSSNGGGYWTASVFVNNTSSPTLNTAGTITGNTDLTAQEGATTTYTYSYTNTDVDAPVNFQIVPYWKTVAGGAVYGSPLATTERSQSINIPNLNKYFSLTWQRGSDQDSEPATVILTQNGNPYPIYGQFLLQAYTGSIAGGIGDVDIEQSVQITITPTITSMAFGTGQDLLSYEQAGTEISMNQLLSGPNATSTVPDYDASLTVNYTPQYGELQTGSVYLTAPASSSMNYSSLYGAGYTNYTPEMLNLLNAIDFDVLPESGDLLDVLPNSFTVGAINYPNVEVSGTGSSQVYAFAGPTQTYNGLTYDTRNYNNGGAGSTFTVTMKQVPIEDIAFDPTESTVYRLENYFKNNPITGTGASRQTVAVLDTVPEDAEPWETVGYTIRQASTSTPAVPLGTTYNNTAGGQEGGYGFYYSGDTIYYNGNGQAAGVYEITATVTTKAGRQITKTINVTVVNSLVTHVDITYNGNTVANHQVQLDMSKQTTYQFGYQTTPSSLNANKVVWSLGNNTNGLNENDPNYIAYASVNPQTGEVTCLHNTPTGRPITLIATVDGLPSEITYITIIGGRVELVGLETIKPVYYIPNQNSYVNGAQWEYTSVPGSGQNLVSMKTNVNLIPEDAENVNLIYTSSDPANVPITRNGGIITVSRGSTASAVITVTSASDPTIKTTFTVQFATPVVSTGLSVENSLNFSFDAQTGVGTPSMANVNATLTPATTTDHAGYSYVSSNTDVAVVDGAGNVYAVGEGTATITTTATVVGTGTVYTGTTQVTVGPTTPVTGLTVSPSTVNLTTAESGPGSATVTATVTPADSTAVVSWESADEEIATVSPATGNSVTITAVGVGNTTVTATAGGQTATVTVNVTEIAVVPTAVTLSPQTMYLATPGEGHTSTGTFTIESTTPAGAATDSLTYSINPTTVATINAQTGAVTAVAEGEATVSISYNGTVLGTANVVVSNSQYIQTNADVYPTTAGDPDLVNVRITLTPNPAVGNTTPAAQASMFMWSESDQGDMNCKVMTNAGNGTFTMSNIPVNGLDASFDKADNIYCHIYASPVAGQNGNMVYATNYDWIQDMTNSGKSVYYVGYSQNIGFDTPTVTDGAMTGTVNQVLQMEGLRVSSNVPGVEILTDVHMQNIGWYSETIGNNAYYADGQYAGTMHENRQIEAVRFRLIGQNATQYTIRARAHVQDLGWLPVVTGQEQTIGTVNRNLQMEAIEIELVPIGQ